jgi:hypothetical protein
MIVWGGRWGTNEYCNGMRYDPETNTWAPVSPVVLCLSGHHAVWGAGRMIVWSPQGGGRYDPVGNLWEPMSEDGMTMRSSHSVVWADSFMIVWGGVHAQGEVFGDGSMYALGHSRDDDGDGLSECDGDCNDGAAHVGPGPERCDGLDNQCIGGSGFGIVDEGCDDDGDGFCDGDLSTVGTPPICPGGGGDCDDGDAGVRFVPTEVAALAVEAAGATTLHFESQDVTAGPATSYDVMAGDLADLTGSGDYAMASCLDSVGDSPAVDTLADPAVGHTRYYLLRARNACGDGSFGDSSLDPDPRDGLDALGPCP